MNGLDGQFNPCGYTHLCYSKAGVQPGSYQSHSGMITGLHFSPHASLHGTPELFVTSAVDWTVKVWALGTSKSTSTAPLCSLEGFEDYVYDVKWSPTHPAMFAAVDGAGKVQVFNLNIDQEVCLLIDRYKLT